jgi:hypothetical protein
LFFNIDGVMHYTDTLDGTWLLSTFPDDGVRSIVSEAADGTLYSRNKTRTELCKSEDAGATFACLDTSVLPGGSVVFWAGETPQGLYVVTGTGAVYLSVDDGQTFSDFGAWYEMRAMLDGTLLTAERRYRPSEGRWFDLTSTLPEQRSGWIPLETGSIIQVVASAAFASGDLGTTWTSLGNGAPAVLAANGAGVVAGLHGNGGGVLIQRDQAWVHIGPSTTLSSIDVAVLADGRVAAVQKNGDLLVTAAPVPATPLVGTAYAASCSDGAQSAGEDAVDCGGDCPACSDWHVLPVTGVDRLVSPTAGTLVALNGASQGYWRSTDDGRTWTKGETPVGASRAIALPGGSIYFTGADLNFYASTDEGVTFARVNTAPLPTNEKLVVTGSGALIVASSGTTAARSTDGGITWEGFTLPTSGDLIALDTGAIFIGTGTLRRSRDDGVTWEALPRPESSASGWAYAAGPSTLGYTSDGYYLSDDEGQTWREIPTPEGVAVQRALRVTEGGRLLYLVDHVHVSDDDGQTWRLAGDRGWFHNGTFPAELIEVIGMLPEGRLVGLGDDSRLRLSTDPASW